MNNDALFKVGLTGGIACGKTSACRVFSALGIPVIDADLISRQLTAKGSPLLARLSALFGADILDENGELRRHALRELVFADNAKLAALNALLHPAIHQELIAQSDAAAARAPYAVLAIPLLFEHHLEHLTDRILVLDCSEALQMERILRRDGSTPETARSMIAHQIPRSYRQAHADDLVDTETGDFNVLTERISALHRIYLHLAEEKKASALLSEA